MKNLIKQKSRKVYKEWDLFFLFLYIFFLPIAHVTTIQLILKLLFALYVIEKYKHLNEFKIAFFEYKVLWIAFLLFFILALLSLFKTPNKIETLKEIKGELIENLIFFIIFFYYAIKLNKNKLKTILSSILIIFLIHNVINIIIWIKHGGWPFRAGALLDTPNGERFGIWITYSIALGIAFFRINKKLSIISLLIFL